MELFEAIDSAYAEVRSLQGPQRLAAQGRPLVAVCRHTTSGWPVVMRLRGQLIDRGTPIMCESGAKQWETKMRLQRKLECLHPPL